MKTKQGVKYFLFLVFFTLVAFEILLRLFGHNKTYSETGGHDYASYYNRVVPTWYHVWTPNAAIMVDQGDFKYLYKTNSEGLREREYSFNKPGAAHIFCIGDSYTEGVGAPYDSSYPRFLERDLNNAGINAEVLNAGSSGSDPFYEYMLYKDKLSPFKAGQVLLCINPSDINDYIFRGGFSRFRADGNTSFNKGPWFEPLYKWSYLVRFWINDIAGYAYGNLFIKKSQLPRVQKEAMEQIYQATDSFQAIATQNNCKLLVIMQPDILNCIDSSAENRYVDDLFKSLQAKLEKDSIAVINLWPPLSAVFKKSNRFQYSYKHDTHYNGKGYQIFARALFDEINKKHPDFWQNKEE